MLTLKSRLEAYPCGWDILGSSVWKGQKYSYGPKGHDSLAQGLPWVSQRNVFSPEGAPAGGECHSCDRKTILPVPYGPFRANSVGEVNPG